MPHKLRHILILLCLQSLAAQAQQSAFHLSDEGRPFYTKHFPAHEYRAHPQNWGIVQSSDGLIYVGNYDGVLIYDGVRWELARTPTDGTARSLAVGSNGEIFVGLQGDFGYLSHDSLGSVTFRSLVSELPEEERDFWDVWSTHSTSAYTYFQTNSRIYRWDGESFRIWKSESGFHTSFRVGDDVYVREKGIGLLRFDGDDLQLIPSGGRFADVRIFLLDEFGEDGILLGTREEGFFVYDGTELRRFDTEADNYLEDHSLYHGVTIQNSYIALGLLDGGGLLLLNDEGKVVQHYTKESGLPDGWVNYVFDDAHGGLWLALNNRGIVQMDVLSELTAFGAEAGLDGFVSDLVRYGSDLYAAVSTGLRKLTPVRRINARAHLERIDGLQVATSTAQFGDKLLVASHEGIHALHKGRLDLIAKGTFFVTSVSSVHADRFYVGSKTGVEMFKWDGHSWAHDADFIPLGEEVRRLVESANGTIWILTRSRRVISATPSGNGYTVRDRTPDRVEIGNQSRLRELNGRTYLLAETGYYILDSSGATAIASFGENDPFVQSSTDSLLVLEQGPDGRIWRVYADRVEITACNNDCVTTSPTVLTYPKWSYPVSLHVDSTGVAWISTGSTLVRYDPSVDAEKNYEAIFPALLRRVTSIDTNRLLYGGLRGAGSSNEAPIFRDLPSDQNAIHLEFALPSYNDPESNEFQYWLEGRDPGWSTWTAETAKNYTNLTGGTYRFHLRGRNAQGYVSPASVYTFTVLPPWYRSTWAYVVYAFGLVGAGLFARRYRRIVVENKRARKQAKALERERQVNERLQDLNNRLELANETLRQADRLKDEFLANTSHELRTPLTGILGCSAILRDEVEGDQREFVNMIDENGQRLLNTLDSLLDLARLRAGLMELDFKEMDLGKKSRTILQTYSSLAVSKGIDLHVETEGDVCGWFDDHCMECMLNHLIGNAVKFTEEGGVRVELAEDDQRIIIRVKDTGIGIDEAFIPFLFDEFKQESTGLTRSHEGNGLGLAVTARIIDLMGGDIEVESEKDVGTTFTVQLPLERVKPGISRQGDGLPGESIDVNASESGSGFAAA